MPRSEDRLGSVSVASARCAAFWRLIWETAQRATPSWLPQLSRANAFTLTRGSSGETQSLRTHPETAARGWLMSPDKARKVLDRDRLSNRQSVSRHPLSGRTQTSDDEENVRVNEWSRTVWFFSHLSLRSLGAGRPWAVQWQARHRRLPTRRRRARGENEKAESRAIALGSINGPLSVCLDATALCSGKRSAV
ncbi:hypothetical protein AAFF_G00183300 [Aldrovandia affinis]|uniref:Uncharacterized protein n=1 Tax=Aldrovandia affinis TaxID=143900 RepID=A0AAD7RKJ4_9TELE|nr:hypothetical protein AAFF_G00183300 [Aldrovandia affinis]